MSEYEDLEYEINEIFDYLVSNPKGNIEDITNSVNISEKNSKIVLNIFAKNNLIEKIKNEGDNGYIFKNEVSVITFAKAINLGIDVNKLEKGLIYKGTIKDIFNFIKSGEFDEAIVQEEEDKKVKFIENIEKQSKEQLENTPLGEYRRLVLEVSEESKEENSELKNLILEMKETMEKEFNNVSNKLVSKKTASIKK